MTKEAATAQAASVMALVAGIATIFTSWIDRFQAPLERIVLTLVTSAGYFGIFTACRWALLRIKNRRLLGRWYYSTREHGDVQFRDRNVAVMDFVQAGSDICYRVALFPDAQALEAAMAGRRGASRRGQRGSARSRTLDYDPSRGCVDLIFDVAYTTGDLADRGRTGRLSLTFQQDGTLHGEYVSQIDVYGDGKAARALSSGVMLATRNLDDLKAMLEQTPATTVPPRAAGTPA